MGRNRCGASAAIRGLVGEEGAHWSSTTSIHAKIGADWRCILEELTGYCGTKSTAETHPPFVDANVREEMRSRMSHGHQPEDTGEEGIRQGDDASGGGWLWSAAGSTAGDGRCCS